MDINGKIRLLETEPVRQFRCYYCGSTVPSYNAVFGICQFCELHTHKTNQELSENKSLVSMLDELHSLIFSSKYDEAAAAFEGFYDATKSSGTIYAKAVSELYFADVEFGKRDYLTPNGYMEDNSIHSKAALSHFSKAKASFYKCISAAEEEMKENVDPSLAYIKFLAQFKLKRYKDAKKSLDLLNSNAKDGPMAIYAGMLYYSEVDTANLLQYFEPALSLGAPAAFYYYSNFLAQRKSLDAARIILTMLLKITEHARARKLLSGIERVQTIL